MPLKLHSCGPRPPVFCSTSLRNSPRGVMRTMSLPLPRRTFGLRVTIRFLPQQGSGPPTTLSAPDGLACMRTTPKHLRDRGNLPHNPPSFMHSLLRQLNHPDGSTFHQDHCGDQTGYQHCFTRMTSTGTCSRGSRICCKRSQCYRCGVDAVPS